MKTAIVGCGFVADQYMSTLVHRRELEIVGAYDQNDARTRAFCEHYDLRPHASLDQLLDDSKVELILNLTNPRSHYAVTERCFEAGKHVYSEKPLSMDVGSAAQLVDLADAKRLRLATAPCNVLGRTAQTLWKAVTDGAVGKPLLVYAAFEAGMIAPHASPWNWKSRTGAHWPAKDEFEIGCTFEHAGYLLTCLLAMFGPAKAVTSYAACLIKDKGIPVDAMAPDLSVGCIEFEHSDVVARVTCGLIAPREKSFMIVGDSGVLTVDSFRDDTAAVYLQRHQKGASLAAAETALEELRGKLEGALPWLPWGTQHFRFRRRYPFATSAPPRVVNRKKRVDFSLGPLELATAIQEERTCRLDGRVGVHVVELINALQYPDPQQCRRVIESRFEPIQPLPWV